MRKAQSNLKMVEEVNRRKVELIVYAAYMMGFMAHSNDQRRITAPDNFIEIHNLIDLISKDI